MDRSSVSSIPNILPRFKGIAFIGNYLPRVCGIATFTYDLAEAVAQQAGQKQPVIVTAMNDIPEGYSYPDRVKFEIRQGHQIDYSRAADFLNFSQIDVVCLQHEYGIFGGEWGSNLLALLRDLNRPLVVTCHTVIKETTPVQKEVFTEIAALATKLVVMSDRAVRFLQDIYGIDKNKIVVIPHGIHDVPFVDPSYYKDQFSVEGRRVLLTFGLLHRNKGIEYMLQALPPVVARHPKTMYVVLGMTHPNVLRHEGESYRLSLQRTVRELGLEQHVLFHPRFVELNELLEYLGAADICVTPYLNLDQITSGALAYAMGSGKAIISTPYWHAEELLADGRGVLVPLQDSKALTDAVMSLLDDEVALSAMRKKAYTYSRHMVWSNVARAYINLFDEVRSKVPAMVPVASVTRRTIAPTNLPTPKLDHLVRLSDDTGVAHHARLTLPDWRYGYRLEDAATALVMSAKYHDIFGDRQAAVLSEIYLALLQVLIGNSADVAEGLDYPRNRIGRASDAALGKTVWALGYTVHHGPDVLHGAANDIFTILLPNTDFKDMRGAAHAVLGAANYLGRFPGALEVKRYLSRHVKRLEALCADAGWIDRWGSADWPVAMQALVVAYSVLEKPDLSPRMHEMIDEIREVTSNGTVFLRLGDNPDEEELPTTAATFIEALGAAFYYKREAQYLAPIRSAVDWFLGANRLNVELYDFSTGGCHDALTPSGLNWNQGTEATCYCQLAFLTLHQLAGIEVAGAEKK
ncbi:MAG: glycosyltransferase family 4 protein [Chitinivibrionia bacterium]|nr:glycosyltransferase family 4 protein [Chitinivibrionia bacterium]